MKLPLSYIAALKCPNCGGLVARNEVKCQYCGADLILMPDSSSFALKNQSVCPKCEAINDKSSWFCPNCSTILTKDIEMLKRLQKKLKYMDEENRQEFLRKVPSSFIKDLEPDEHFYCTLSREQGGNFYGVTNKRIIKFKDGNYTEIPLGDVVNVYPIRSKIETRSLLSVFLPIPTQMTLEFEVSTYNGIIKIDGLKGTPAYCGSFYGFVMIAVDNYEKGKKYVAHSILKLPLE